jgi:hypothetical protein
MENMIVNGKSDVLWRTIYANEYLENDTEKNQQITFYLGNSSRFQNE